jgi:hypothetical protein
MGKKSRQKKQCRTMSGGFVFSDSETANEHFLEAMTPILHAVPVGVCHDGDEFLYLRVLQGVLPSHRVMATAGDDDHVLLMVYPNPNPLERAACHTVCEQVSREDDVWFGDL